VVARHLRLGWMALLLFLSLGALLEGLNGFKVAWYVSASNETRRHMWTLAHAHGTLLGLIHIAYAATLRLAPDNLRHASLGSTLLTAALVLLPGGFFLGGIKVYGGDPGLGILLVPFGAATLSVAVGLTVWDLTRSK